MATRQPAVARALAVSCLFGLTLACADPVAEPGAQSGDTADTAHVDPQCGACVKQLVTCIVDDGASCAAGFADCFFATGACPCSEPPPPQDGDCADFHIGACLDDCATLADGFKQIGCRLNCRANPCVRPPGPEPTCTDCIGTLDACLAENALENPRCKDEFAACYFALGDVVACPFNVIACLNKCDTLADGFKQIGCKLNCRAMDNDPLDKSRCIEATGSQ